jgi:ABC-type transporter Mla MlaB component
MHPTISDCASVDDPSNDVKNAREAGPHATQLLNRTCIEIERSEGWMPVEELREAALDALRNDADPILSLDRINHLDASALQVLLAFQSEQKERGQDLQLTNVPLYLRQWFEYAGAADRFDLTS